MLWTSEENLVHLEEFTQKAGNFQLGNLKNVLLTQLFLSSFLSFLWNRNSIMLTLIVIPIPAELTQGCQCICWERSCKLCWLIIMGSLDSVDYDSPYFFFHLPILILHQYCSSILLPLRWFPAFLHSISISLDSGPNFCPHYLIPALVLSSTGGIWIHCTPAPLQQLSKCHPLGDTCKTLRLSLKWLLFSTGGKSIERSSRWDPSLKCTLNGLFHFWLRGWTASLSCSKNTVKLCQLPQQCAMQITSSETSTDLILSLDS